MERDGNTAISNTNADMNGLSVALSGVLQFGGSCQRLLNLDW